MKLRLSREAQHRTGIDVCIRQRVDALNASKSGAVNRVELLRQFCDRTARWQKQVAVQPFKITVDVMVADNSLGTIDGRSVALRRQSRAFVAEKLFNIDVTIIDRVHQVGS